MTESYTIGSLAGLTLDALVALVNGVYADYPGPFSPEDVPGYAEFCRVQQIDGARSVAAWDAAGTPLGFGLLGVRGTRGWIGEFGVLPAWRRQGVGGALLARLLDTARAAGLRDLRLEVAAGNAPAQRLYAAAGFRPTRVTHNYAVRAATPGMPLAALVPDLELVEGDAALLAADLGLPSEPAPAWDHELPALLVAGDTRTLLARRAGAPVGLLQVAPGPDDVEIRRLAVAPGDLATARVLLAAVAGDPPARLVGGYVAADSPLAALLPALGCHELAPDLEMAVRL